MPAKPKAFGQPNEDTKKYIQKAFINGKEITSPFITHKQIMDGGTLELILDELPNKEWGRDAKIPYN